MNYKEYLKTEHWKDIRKKVLANKGYKCYVCNTCQDLHVHHRFYKDRQGSILFREKRRHFYVLCSRHHQMWHQYFFLKKTMKCHMSILKDMIKAGINDEFAFKMTAKRLSLAKKILKQKMQ